MSSLADRVSKPDSDMNASNSSSWTDETRNANQAEQDMSDMEKAQTDGAAGENTGIVEPSYDVNVKLSDLQADPNDPLHSTTSFEALPL